MFFHCLGQKYLCDFKHCGWDKYVENEDWGYYSKNNSDCNFCQQKCEMDDNCSGVECGGRIDYCSWWKIGKCITEREKDVDVHYHVTCTKIQGNLFIIVFSGIYGANKELHLYIWSYILLVFYEIRNRCRICNKHRPNKDFRI